MDAVLFHLTRNLDADGPLLVLTHGVGGHADLWLPFITALARTRARSGLSPLPAVAVDLAGHGRSAHQRDYSIAAQARAVGEVIDEVLDEHFDAQHPVLHLGHSMGGMVGLVDAASRPTTRAVLCCATKYGWLDRELAGLARQAGKPVRTHADEAEARRRHLALTGLAGILPDNSSLLTAGIRQTPDGWQVAQDPGTYDIGPPDAPSWRARAGAPVHWSVGSADPLIGLDTLAEVTPHVFTGLGHNPHLEDPDALAEWAHGVLDHRDALT